MNERIRLRDQERGIFLYVLMLQNDNLYIGITNNPKRRFRKHRSGTSIKFINENLPIIEIRKILLRTTDRNEALRIETRTTFLLMQQFGVEKVSGGAITGGLITRRIRFNNLL